MNIEEKIETILSKYTEIIRKRKITMENKRNAKILLNEQNRLKKLQKKKLKTQKRVKE